MKKILITRLSSIGDIVLATPLVRSVRQKFPEAQIDFLIKKQFADLMRHNPHITNLIEFDKQKENALKNLTVKLQNVGYDWFIDIHKNLRTTKLKRACKSSLATTYSKQILRRTLLVYFGVNFYKNFIPVYKRYFEAVEGQGVEYDGNGSEIFFPDAIAKKIDDRLKNDAFIPNQKLVTICPAASFVNKQWMPENFAAVGEHLARQNVFVVLLGGPKDYELCREISNNMKNAGAIYAGQLSLLESAALLKKSDFVITNDSGMMHLAESQKTPAIAIFGPTTRELGYFPMLPESVAIEAKVKCRPCTHNGLKKCPKKHFDCMNKIQIHSVIYEAEKMLEKFEPAK